MAYRQVQLLAVVAAVACLAPLAFATTFMVGDGLGWRAKFNETGWTDGKTFLVNDTLMFMYDKEKHTVAQVGKDDFAACNLQGNVIGAGGVMTSGNDVVTLDKLGKWWFICTKPTHCLGGMKLVVNVIDPALGPGAMAPPPSSAPAVSVGGAVAAVAGAVAAAVLAF